MKYDSEGLVSRAYKRHGLNFEHARKNGYLDRIGIDFRIFLNVEGYEVPIDLQVKTADRSMTAGFVLPLPQPIPINIYVRISERMLIRIFDHSRKHPDVRYMLFVARLERRMPEERIVRDIWRESQGMFSRVPIIRSLVA
ncbi:hypothetical protein M1432_01745 [Patescibacteria group bacterium]|nr:hypothetical protein [Patescibacteria group bacterium]